ncbi:amino acid ABC transporter permease [Rhodococcus koreensis]
MPLKPSRRKQIQRSTSYLALAAIVVVVATSVNWTAFRANFLAPAGFIPPGTWPDLIATGAKNTLLYTLISFSGGLLFGLILALMKLSSVPPYRWLSTSFIELFRGLPALLVVLFMAFGIPIAFQTTPPGGPVGAGLLGLILVSGAYMAETIRAGIQAVPRGQTEAARSLGMSSFNAMATVVLPQAFRIVIPPLTNEFVLLIKDTALLFVIGFAADQRELTTVARDFLASGPTAGTSTSLVQAAVLYLVITLPLTRVVAWLETRQRRVR